MIRLDACPRPRLVLLVALACVWLPRLPPAQGYGAGFELYTPCPRGRLAHYGFLTGGRKVIEDELFEPFIFCAPEDDCNVCGQKGDMFLPPNGSMSTQRTTKFYPNDTDPYVTLSVIDNAGGYFEFRICNPRKKYYDEGTKPQESLKTQACYDKYVLEIDESRIRDRTRFMVKDKTRLYIPRNEWYIHALEIPLKWPTEDWMCKHCVLQTSYYPAENVTMSGVRNCERYPNSAKECKQRVMRTCSDIAISKYFGKYANKEALREWFLNENGTIEYDPDYKENSMIIFPMIEPAAIIDPESFEISTPRSPEMPMHVADCSCKCPDLTGLLIPRPPGREYRMTTRRNKGPKGGNRGGGGGAKNAPNKPWQPGRNKEKSEYKSAESAAVEPRMSLAAAAAVIVATLARM